MFGIGTMELFVILLVGVMVLGPEHLPKLVRTLTKAMSDVRRVSTDFQRAINLEANREEWEQEQKQKQAEAAPKKKKKKKAAPAQPPHPDTVDTAPNEEEMPAVSAVADAAPADKAEEEAPAPAAAPVADAHGDKT